MLSIKFKTKVDSSSYWQTIQSTKKNDYFVDYIPYRTKKLPTLSFMTTVDIAFDENSINFNDYSSKLYGNSVISGNYKESYPNAGVSRTIPFNSFLVTDEVSDVDEGDPIPYFYKHEITGLAATYMDIDSVKVYDWENNLVDKAYYRAEKIYVKDDNGADTSEVESVRIYHALENEVKDIGSLKVYYVTYAGGAQRNQTSTVLKNNPIFGEASLEDINPVTMKIKSWVKKYIINQIDGSYQVVTPKAGTYYFKSLGKSLRIFRPQFKDLSEPWYFRVHNIGITDYYVKNSIVHAYQYSIPEFEDSGFVPFKPYRRINLEYSTVLDKYLIKLDNNNIINEIIYFVDSYIYIYVFDADFKMKYALTTNSAYSDKVARDLDGTAVDLKWIYGAITGIDEANGILQINKPLEPDDIILSTYSVSSDYMELTDLNCNPFYNVTDDLQDRTIVFYCIPKCIENSNLAQNKSIFYLLVDKDGLIVDGNQDSSSSHGNADIIDGVDYAIKFDAMDSTKGMYYRRSSGTMALDAHIGYHTSFIDEFTIHGNTTGNGYTLHRYLVLAEVSYKELNPELMLDIRVRGGGVKEEYRPQAMLKNPLVQWFNGGPYENGLIVPGTVATTLKVPQTVLEDFGGSLTRDAAKELIYKHSALGSFLNIDYYGVDVFVEDFTLNTTSIEITWKDESPLYSFNVYYHTSYDLPEFTKANASVITGTTYTITGLTSNTLYYFYVQCVDNLGEEVGKSSVYRVMTDG